MAEKQPKLMIVEVDKDDAKPLGSAKELHAQIISLQSHPGFEELLRRLRLVRTILEARLRNPQEDENRHYLRAAIEAYGFLERQLKIEVSKPVEQPRDAYAEELAEYERLTQFVEFVGRNAN